jgi:hypothetical protein
MDKEYQIYEKDLKKALDQLDNFQTKMELFTGKYPRFKYNVNVSKQEDGWLILLNIKTKDEKRTAETS